MPGLFSLSVETDCVSPLLSGFPVIDMALFLIYLFWRSLYDRKDSGLGTMSGCFRCAVNAQALKKLEAIRSIVLLVRMVKGPRMRSMALRSRSESKRLPSGIQ